MKLKDISYKEEPGTEEILDGVKYVKTDAYFMASGDIFRIYLPINSEQAKAVSPQ